MGEITNPAARGAEERRRVTALLEGGATATASPSLWINPHHSFLPQHTLHELHTLDALLPSKKYCDVSEKIAIFVFIL